MEVGEGSVACGMAEFVEKEEGWRRDEAKRERRRVEVVRHGGGRSMEKVGVDYPFVCG